MYLYVLTNPLSKYIVVDIKEGSSVIHKAGPKVHFLGYWARFSKSGTIVLHKACLWSWHMQIFDAHADFGCTCRFWMQTIYLILLINQMVWKTRSNCLIHQKKDASTNKRFHQLSIALHSDRLTGWLNDAAYILYGSMYEVHKYRYDIRCLRNSSLSNTVLSLNSFKFIFFMNLILLSSL